MVWTVARMGRVACGLLAGLGAGLATPLAAQAFWLPASDPVGIARGGAGVAFGQSLEAAALNPALLATLREDRSAYLSAGMDMQSSQATLGSNSEVLFSSDRNRILPALGAAWKLRPDFWLGLKADNPFMRHATMPAQYSGRFESQSFGLDARRLELQAAWAASPNWSFGASLGMTHVTYEMENSVRVPVPQNPDAPVSAGNPALGMGEMSLAQSGKKLVPSYSLGFRYAINPRWTLGGSYQGAISGTLPLAATNGGINAYTGINGYGAPEIGTSAYGPALAAATSVRAGDGGFSLPGKLQVGIRQRVNQAFTWEADLRYVLGASTRLPGYPTLTGPSGVTSGAATGGGPGSQVHGGTGASLAGEVLLTKRLTGRLGLSTDPGLRNDPYLEPTFGGARSAAFSAGLGWRVFGGEASFGWQVRQSQDRDVTNLDGLWKLAGYTTTGATTRVEGMGHLWSLGFKKAF